MAASPHETLAKKKQTFATANHSHGHRYHLLGAKAGSGGAAGVIRGSYGRIPA
jgi:hypothetical protein